MNLSDFIFKTESNPSEHGAILPVIQEMGTNFFASVDVGLPMIAKAYELSPADAVQSPTPSTEINPAKPSLDELFTDTDEERREKVSPAVAQVATGNQITNVQAYIAAEARSVIAKEAA